MTTKENVKTEEKTEEETKTEEKAAETAPETAETQEKEVAPEKPTEGEPPTLNYSSFILSLSSSALMSLGVIDNPVTGKKELAPAIAKQTIDLIALLKEKTAGNLDDGEMKLMDDVLAELHLWYCKVVG